MKTSLLFLVIGVVAVIQAVAMPATAAAVYGGSNPIGDRDDTVPEMYGAPYPIDNIDAPWIQRLGEWAVSEHVKRGNSGLKFGKVVSGEAQSVAGMNYFLFVEALNGDGENGTYKAWVYNPMWANTQEPELVSFGPAN